MRCISCGSDVPPQFIKAIETNICPACGESIATEETRALLNELTEAFSSMPNDPQGLANWVLSNYRVKKIGTCQPVEAFPRKGKSKDTILVDDAEYNQFIERTNMKNAIANAHNVAAKFKSQQSKLDRFEHDDEENAFEDLEQEDLMALQEMQAQAAGKSSTLTADDILAIQQSSESIGGNLTPDEAALLQTKEGKDFVMKSRMKRIKSQQVFKESGRSFKFGR